jgi:hypothetical protein
VSNLHRQILTLDLPLPSHPHTPHPQNILTPGEVTAEIESLDARDGMGYGPRVVARAWTDPDFMVGGPGQSRGQTRRWDSFRAAGDSWKAAKARALLDLRLLSGLPLAFPPACPGTTPKQARLLDDAVAACQELGVPTSNVKPAPPGAAPAPAAAAPAPAAGSGGSGTDPVALAQAKSGTVLTAVANAPGVHNLVVRGRARAVCGWVAGLFVVGSLGCRLATRRQWRPCWLGL